MKLSRSYLLGLGSGLILSALLAMVVPPVSINFAGSSPPEQTGPGRNTPGNENQGDVPSQGEGENKDGNNQGLPENPMTSETGENPLQNSGINSGSPSGADSEKTFAIPSGSTADKIADLLLAEGWISSKEEFLNLVKQKNLAGRFRAGSFGLSEGMDTEEILKKLIPKQ
ncbi:MAG TPA: endolytic transglycosylase MltG [Desulfitobacterium dehalogenans]|uniref:Endolytic transglycosylase MltG n=1 Tax=Desulfitobacterium dehalogenans TaxID=36854 RepID=A0A7C6Z627_9FIRM|nr:endolytic transglycosylase MltG [Desulfitobacterium dehalogenans]